MAEEDYQRKLSAILSADVAGYSLLMRDDEAATVRTITVYRKALTQLIQQYRGRVVDSPGDNILAEFNSVVDAVNCAVEIQRDLAERNAELPEDRRMRFRIGINLGDVIIEGTRIYGDGVNIAARMEGLADVGGICISGTVYDAIESKTGLDYEFIGEQEVKNIDKPVRAYQVLSFPGAAAHRVVKAKKAIPKKWLSYTVAAVVLGLVMAAGFFAWNNFLRTSTVEKGSAGTKAFSLPDKPSIAVVPFKNLSGDPEQEYFSDGMTDDLITDLSKLSGLIVISRNSTFFYKDSDVPVKQVAMDLGVNYVLEGSVRKFESQVRINSQLIDVATGEHLWAERYDRDYEDIFLLQDEVIQRIVFALSVKLTQKEKEHLARKYTDNLKAYDYYLRGMQSLHKLTLEGIEKSKSMFEKAIDLDPKFAQAYAAHGMASYYIWRYTLTESHYRFENDRTQASQFAKEAMALDSNLPMSHSVLAGIHLTNKLFDEAISYADKAVALEPNNADSYVTKAYVLTNVGRHEEAQKEIDMAFRLNPTPPAHYYLNLSEIQFNLRKYSEAVESVKKTETTFPAWLQSRILAPCYACLNRLDEARSELLKFVKVHFRFQLYMVRDYSYRKQEEDNQHWYEGFRKAGLQDVPKRYRRYMDDIVENMLPGKEIRDLAVGRTWSGIDPESDGQWWIQFNKEGELSARGVWGEKNGSFWVEEYRICWKWDGPKVLKDGCGFVYPIPTDTTGGKNRYEWVNYAFAYPFSVEE